MSQAIPNGKTEEFNRTLVVTMHSVSSSQTKKKKNRTKNNNKLEIIKLRKRILFDYGQFLISFWFYVFSNWIALHGRITKFIFPFCYYHETLLKFSSWFMNDLYSYFEFYLLFFASKQTKETAIVHHTA